MADVYSALIIDSDWWDGTESWGGELTESARDAKFGARLYTSMSAWESARDGSSSIGDTEIAQPIGPWTTKDSSYLFFLGWNATPKVSCPAVLNDGQLNPSWHEGNPYKTNAYALEMSRTSYLMYVGVDLELERIILNNTDEVETGAQLIRLVAAELTLNACILNAPLAGDGISVQNSAAILTAKNCLFMLDGTPGSSAVGIDASSIDSADIYNNVFTGFYKGIEISEGDWLIKNCAFIDCMDQDIDDNGATTISVEYNSAEDDLDTIFSETTNEQVSSWAGYFTNVANFLFTIPGASPLIDSGVGPSVDANVPATDYEGDARSGATCTKGFDEYISVVSGNPWYAYAQQ